jgi:hypothetical protein
MNDNLEVMDTKNFKPEKARKILEEHGMHICHRRPTSPASFNNN